VTVLLRPRGDRVVRDRDIAAEARALLRKLGRDAVAAAFMREFSSTLSGDGGEEAVEGRRLAMKLRECAVSAK
jgi:hypothetical protein